MAINVPGLSNRSTSPGAPAPITFGMQNGLMDSAAITPGAGAMGYYGDPVAPSTVGPATAAAQSDVKDMGTNFATTMPTMVINGYSPQIAPANPFFGVSSGASFGIDPSGIQPNTDTTNLAPVNVTAAALAPTTPLDQAWMWGNDHPFLSGLAKSVVGSVTGLSPVIVAADAYEKYKHGISPLDSLNPLGGAISNLFSGAGDSGGTRTGAGFPAAGNSLLTPPAAGPQNPYGDGAAGNGGLSIATSGGLPNYLGLGALGGFWDAPIGGYWNQQALKMAAPAYGPYAGFASHSSSAPTLSNIFAPTGITPMGY